LPIARGSLSRLMCTLCGAWIKLCVGRASEAGQSKPIHLHLEKFQARDLLYWLPGTSVPTIDNLVYHHPSIFLCHVILIEGERREIFLVHERKTLIREKRALPCSRHSGELCKGYILALPKVSPS
jgi:hypothetical protein